MFSLISLTGIGIGSLLFDPTQYDPSAHAPNPTRHTKSIKSRPDP